MSLDVDMGLAMNQILLSLASGFFGALALLGAYMAVKINRHKRKIEAVEYMFSLV